MTQKLSPEQKVFNKVARHLLKQNERSVSVTGQCQYRGLNGRRCGIGWLIPDHLYSTSLENQRVGSTPILNVLIKAGYTEVALKEGNTGWFLTDLQRIHDGYSTKFWRAELQEFANRYKLTFPTNL